MKVINSEGLVHYVRHLDNSGYATYFTMECGREELNFGSITWVETGEEVNCKHCISARKEIEENYRLFKCTARTIEGTVSRYIVAKGTTDASLGVLLEPGGMPTLKSTKMKVEQIKFDKRKVLSYETIKHRTDRKRNESGAYAP